MGLRIDRLTTLYVVDPLRRTFADKASIPILMYHSIADEDESRVHPYYRTSTAPRVFAAQMESFAPGWFLGYRSRGGHSTPERRANCEKVRGHHI